MYDDATLWKLLDRELPPAEAERIETAAAADPTLRERLERLRALKDGVLDGAPVPSPGFADRVAAAAEGRPQLRIVREKARPNWWLVAASLLLAAVGIANLVVELSDPDPLTAENVPSPKDIELRLKDYEDSLEEAPLSPLQRRRLREILARHDREDGKIRRLTEEQLRRIVALEQESREKVHAVLTEEQRAALARVEGENLLRIRDSLAAAQREIFDARLKPEQWDALRKAAARRGDNLAERK